MNTTQAGIFEDEPEGDIPVSFTLVELWTLSDFIRHEIEGQQEWRFPPASKRLNRQIADAILACEDSGLDSYTLLLSEGNILTIDFWIRRSYKTPEGFSGKELLLKLFRARAEREALFPTSEFENHTYSEALKEKEEDTRPKAEERPPKKPRKKASRTTKEKKDARSTSDNSSQSPSEESPDGASA